jgi:hypothetical protein
MVVLLLARCVESLQFPTHSRLDLNIVCTFSKQWRQLVRWWATLHLLRQNLDLCHWLEQSMSVEISGEFSRKIEIQSTGINGT